MRTTNPSKLALVGILVILFAAACSRTDQRASDTPASSSQPAATPTQAPPAETGAKSTPSEPAQPSASATPPASAPPSEPPAASPPPAPPPPPPEPKTFQIPAGTPLRVRTITPLSTASTKTGDTFQATLQSSLTVGGVVIARSGSDVQGRVSESDHGGRVKGKASLTLQIAGIKTVDGQTLEVSTSPLVQEAKSTKKKDAARIGIGAGVGAAIGAIAGGGRGAAIGAGVGGAGGTAATLATRGAAAEVPSESVLSFTIAAPLSVTEKRAGSLVKKKAAAAAEQ